MNDDVNIFSESYFFDKYSPIPGELEGIYSNNISLSHDVRKYQERFQRLMAMLKERMHKEFPTGNSPPMGIYNV